MKANGFTLIEIIVVIVMIGILVSFSMEIVTTPIMGYYNQQSRNTLSDNAEMVLQQIERDIHQALPNSVRVSSNGLAIEMLHVSDGGRYRAKQSDTGAGDILDFTQADTSFDVIGSLSNAPSGYVVVYNIGGAISDAYLGNNRADISPSSTIGNVVIASKQFPQTSPSQRFFVVDTPITYVCDVASGKILRYYGYVISTLISSSPGGSSDIQANNIASCLFSYNPGSPMRSGNVELRIGMIDNRGESLSLMYEVHVENAP